MIRKKLVMFTLVLSSMTLTFCAPGRRTRTSGTTIAPRSSTAIKIRGNDNQVITITNPETGAVIATTPAEKNKIVVVNRDLTVTTFQVSNRDFRLYNNKSGAQQIDFLRELAQKYNASINLQG